MKGFGWCEDGKTIRFGPPSDWSYQNGENGFRRRKRKRGDFEFYRASIGIGDNNYVVNNWDGKEKNNYVIFKIIPKGDVKEGEQTHKVEVKEKLKRLRRNKERLRLRRLCRRREMYGECHLV